MVFDHEKEHRSRWAAVSSIANKIGCAAHSLNEWVKKAEVDSGTRAGLPSEVAEQLKALERENRELRQANEILRKASAYFAMAELDRRSKDMIAFIEQRSSFEIGTVVHLAPPTHCQGQGDPKTGSGCSGRADGRAHRPSRDLFRVFPVA